MGILNEQYLKYVRAVDCDDAAVAEGWDDAVARLLARSWADVPALDQLVKADPEFLPFVVRHIGATAAPDDLQQVRANAQGRCPSGEYEELCRLVAEAAAAALADGGCSYRNPPKDEADARRRIGVLTQSVHWTTTLRVDLVGKGVPDYVMLGRRRSEFVVGVVLGTACDKKFVFTFKSDAGTQDGLCGDPASASASPRRGCRHQTIPMRPWVRREVQARGVAGSAWSRATAIPSTSSSTGTR